MSPRLLHLYHSMPPWVQSLAATARGWNLRRWRYTDATDALVERAFEREQWTPAQWSDWQRERLRALLERAVHRVPYYRDWWAARKCEGAEDWKILSNWPILEKETLRAKPLAFLADDCDPRRMFPEHTSGSTGTPLHLWWSRETTRSWYALFEARWKRWYGVSRHDRWGMLGGQRVVPASRSRPPYWVWNAAMHQLYMSAFHMSPESMPSYLDAIRHYRLRYLWGYSASLYQLAQIAIERGVTIPLQVVITNAEPLFAFQREVISKAFACPVRETYGMAEIVYAASECEQNRLHQWPEVGIAELLDGELPVPRGEPGELVATGLVNLDMPLIRYRTGDRIALDPGHDACSCGRLLPLMRSVEGRLDDVITTPSGRKIGRLDPVFKGGLPIREAQVVQQDADRLLVRFVPAPDYTEKDGERLKLGIREYVGEMEVLLQQVPFLPRNANGKFRSVIREQAPLARP